VNNRTGFAQGQLSPIIFFQNSDGQIILPPDTENARWIYETRFRKLGYDWREAGTLAEVDQLQKRLVAQEMQKAEHDADRDEAMGAAKWKEVGDRLHQRMVSSATPEFEREFIKLYLQLREEKRDKHRQRWTEREWYLFSREMDSSTKGTDRMKAEDGDCWARGV
jgi:hypothetical protein